MNGHWIMCFLKMNIEMNSFMKLFRARLPQVFRSSSAMQGNVATLAVWKHNGVNCFVIAFTGLRSECHIYIYIYTYIYIYIHIHINMYISAGLLGGHQAVEHSFSRFKYWSLQFLSKFADLQIAILKSFPNFKSCRLQSWNTPYWSLQVGCLEVVGLRGWNFLPSTDHVTSALEPASQTIEFNEIPMIFQYPQKPSK